MSGRFVEPVLTLLSGVAVAQVLTYAARPILTRIYGPEEFGILTVFIALLGLVVACGTGHFEDALMLPARRADAARLLMLALGTSAVSAVLVGLAMLFRGPIAVVLGGIELAPSLLLLPLAGLAAAAAQAVETWHTRFDRYSVVSSGRISQGLVTIAIQLGAGVAGIGAIGLAAGATAGFLALLVPTGYVLLRRDGLLLRAALRRPDDLRAVGRRYRRFPLFTAPAALLNVFAGRVPVFGLAVAFGPGPTGIFGLAFATLALPVGMVTAAMGQVFFVRAAEAHRHGALGPLTRQMHARLVALAAYPIAAAAVAGPDLFGLVFGSEWTEAGLYARILAPWLLLSAVAPPLGRVFDVTEHQRTDLAFSALQAVGLTLALVVAAQSGEHLVAVALAGAVGALLRALQIGWLLRTAGAPVADCAGDFAEALLRAAPFLVAGHLTAYFTGSILLQIAVLTLGGLGYYYWSADADRAIERLSD